MQNNEELDREENILRDEIGKLSNDDRKIFYSKIENKIKDPDTYAVLNWIFIAGIHHFYLRKWLNGTINIAVFTVGVVFLFASSDVLFGVGIGMLVSLFVVELVQLFRSQQILKSYNNEISKKILREFKEKA